MSKSAILALVVVAALAAGTALVAGYVDAPTQSVQVTAESKCDGCPKAGTEACCKVGDACPKAEACANACPKSTCEEAPAAGCCPAMAACCPARDSEAQVQSPCCAGGGTETK